MRWFGGPARRAEFRQRCRAGWGFVSPPAPRSRATSPPALCCPRWSGWAAAGPAAALTSPPQMYIALSSVHALILCGLQFISCVRGQWTGELGPWVAVPFGRKSLLPFDKLNF